MNFENKMIENKYKKGFFTFIPIFKKQKIKCNK